MARIAAATAFLLHHVLSRRGVVRALSTPTITRPGDPQARPGLRFSRIDDAQAPLGDTRCRLPRRPGAAITSIVHTATTLTRAALREQATGDL